MFVWIQLLGLCKLWLIIKTHLHGLDTHWILLYLFSVTSMSNGYNVKRVKIYVYLSTRIFKTEEYKENQHRANKHIVRKFQKSNTKTEKAKSIPLTHIYMTTLSPGLVHCHFNKKLRGKTISTFCRKWNQGSWRIIRWFSFIDWLCEIHNTKILGNPYNKRHVILLFLTTGKQTWLVVTGDDKMLTTRPQNTL